LEHIPILGPSPSIDIYHIERREYKGYLGFTLISTGVESLETLIFEVNKNSPDQDRGVIFHIAPGPLNLSFRGGKITVLGG
jgi:hypothetical protein